MIGTTVKQYKILERIGAGGMGVVYRAEDTRLGRIVALKFLPPYALDSEEDRARFVIEAQSAAALDHPNICTIHEIGDAGEHQFIVMAYVAGPSLKERLKDGAIEPAEAVNIAAQIASGLTKAHEKGIIHRDIKPANILLAEGGLVKVCDFGLAKSSISKKVTRTGSTIGTAAYMSPEQARSEVVDQRTDIWSLGVILYEMLAGKPPFVADHEAVVIYAILNDECPPLEEKRPGLPQELYRIVKKALAHKSADRYNSMEEMRRDLKAVASQIKGPSTTSGAFPIVQPSTTLPAKSAVTEKTEPIRVPASPVPEPPKPKIDKGAEGPKKKSSPVLYLVIATLTLAAVLAVVWFNKKPKVEAPTEEVATAPAPTIAPPEAAGDAETSTKSQAQTATSTLPTIAVLYFDNLSANRDDQYFAAGITEDLINALAKIKSIKVKSRYDVLPLEGQPFSATDMGKRLGADYLIEGGVDLDKKQLHMTTHLHRVADQDLVWSLKYDRPATDVFALRSEIADSLAKTLALTLAPEDRSAVARPASASVDAYDQYLRGRYSLDRTTIDDNALAEKAFRRAITLDRDFIAAQFGLARTLLQAVSLGWDEDDKVVDEAAALVQKAAIKDTSSNEYFAAYGSLLSVRDNFVDAVRAHRRVLQNSLDDPDALLRLGADLAQLGQIDEANKSLKHVLDLKPNSSDAYRWLGIIAANSGRQKEAENYFKTALELSPRAIHILVANGWYRNLRGDFERADSLFQRALTINPKLYRNKGYAGTNALFLRRATDAAGLLKETCVKVSDWRLCLRLAQAYQLSGAKQSQTDRTLKDAATEAQTELSAHLGDLETELGLLYIRVLSGEIKDAEPEFKRLATNTQKTLDPTIRYYYTAAIDAQMGQTDRAIEYIDKILKMNVCSPSHLGADPAFEKLKQDTRFQKLVGATPSS